MMEDEGKETKIEKELVLDLEELSQADKEILQRQDGDDGAELDVGPKGDTKNSPETNPVKKKSSRQVNQATNTTFTVVRESDGRTSKVSLSIEENKENDQLPEDHLPGDQDPDESLYQTVLMGNDSMTGCAILDPNSKFGNLSIINPPPVQAGGVPSMGQFSMQAHAGSMEELETYQDRGDRGQRRHVNSLNVSKSLNLGLWPSSKDSKNFELYGNSSDEEEEGVLEGDVADGLYPDLTDTEEGHQLDLKDFEEQERAICGSLGFDVDKKHWDEYEDDELRVLKPPSKRERKIQVSFALEPPTPRGSRPQASKAVQVQFNESSALYRTAGLGVPAPIKVRVQHQQQLPPVKVQNKFVPPTRPAPPEKFVEKAILSTRIPMGSRKTATTELTFFSSSTKKPESRRGGGDSDGNTGKENTQKIQVVGGKHLYLEDHIYDSEKEQEEIYQVPKVPRPLRREKLEAFSSTGSAFTYTPDPKKMAAHQSAFFSKKKCNHEDEEGGSFNFSMGGHGHDGPHSCYLCAPVPEGVITLLKDKIGLTATEARRSGYLFLTYLKDQRHTESVREVMRYLLPDIYEGRHPGFSSKLNTKM